MNVNRLYYVYSYHNSSILLQVHSIFIICDSCHNITIGDAKLSVLCIVYVFCGLFEHFKCFLKSPNTSIIL